MRRHLKILEFALSALWRRRFKNLAIVVVYGFTIAVLASILLMTDALRGEAEQILLGAPDLVVQRVAAGRHDLIPVNYAEEIRGLPGSVRSARATGATTSTPLPSRTSPSSASTAGRRTSSSCSRAGCRRLPTSARWGRAWRALARPAPVTS